MNEELEALLTDVMLGADMPEELRNRIRSLRDDEKEKRVFNERVRLLSKFLDENNPIPGDYFPSFAFSSNNKAASFIVEHRSIILELLK